MPAALEQVEERKEKEEWEGDWDKEKAPNDWHEGATVDPAVDPDRCQDANGGSCGGGTPARQEMERMFVDSSRSPRGKHGKMEDDGLL